MAAGMERSAMKLPQDYRATTNVGRERVKIRASKGGCKVLFLQLLTTVLASGLWNGGKHDRLE